MRTIRSFLLVALIGSISLLLVGCGKVVPPGTTVLVIKPDGTSEIITHGAYKAWGRAKAYFVDTKLKTYSKDLKILCDDDINMDVRVKWVGSFRVSEGTIETIKNKVPATPIKRGDMEGFQLSLDEFYKIAMDDIVSSITRGKISVYKTDNIRPQREEIQKDIKETVLARFRDLKYPIDTTDVMLTNLDYPQEVTAMRKQIKNAELKDLENAAIAKAEVAKAKRDAELAGEKGKAELVKAESDAAANRVRAASLTPEILAVKQLEMLARLAAGPNNSVVVVPFDALGGGSMLDDLMIKRSLETLPAKKIVLGEPGGVGK